MPEPTHTPGPLRFGVFEIDLGSGELRKQGARIKLQEQPFQVLAVLLQHPGDVVTREELRQRLWSADTFVDFDDGVNTAIKKIRDVLGDSAESPRFVETLPRRGYRFLAPVQETAVARATPPTKATSSEEDVSQPDKQYLLRSQSFLASRASRIGAALLVTAGVVILALIAVQNRNSARFTEVQIRSIAVLPLENLSGDSSQEYFADGMTDAIITSLAQISSLRVISRTSTMQYKHTRSSLAEIGRKLNVDAVVEGAVVRSGDRVRITAQLVHAASDRHLWAHSYESDLRGVLALQDEVALDVTQQIKANLTTEEQARLARSRSVNPEAYDYYLRGRFHFYHKNREDVAASIGLFEKSVTLDPNFALPHAYLARSYNDEVFLYQADNKHLDQLVLNQLNLALALDPDLAEAHFARAGVLDTHKNHFPYEEVVRELRRAIELNPNFDEAHQHLGAAYNHIGLLEKGAEELQKALAINPSYTGARFRVGVNLLSQGKYEQALSAFEGTQKFIPSLWTFQRSLALFHLGRKQEASALVNKFLETEPQDEGGVVTAMQALLLADRGRTTEAEQKIQEAIRKGKGFGHFHHTAYAIGSAYAVMNDRDRAIKWLQMAADDGFPCFPMFENDSTLDGLRGDPHFISFMSSLKTRWEQYKAEL